MVLVSPRRFIARNDVLTKAVGRSFLVDEPDTLMRLLRHFLEQLHAITVQVTEESDALHVLREVDQLLEKAGDGIFSFVLINDWLRKMCRMKETGWDYR